VHVLFYYLYILPRLIKRFWKHFSSQKNRVNWMVINQILSIQRIMHLFKRKGGTFAENNQEIVLYRIRVFLRGKLNDSRFLISQLWARENWRIDWRVECIQIAKMNFFLSRFRLIVSTNALWKFFVRSTSSSTSVSPDDANKRDYPNVPKNFCIHEQNK